MGHWVFQGKGSSSKGLDKTGEYTDIYEASKGEGEAESITQGFVLGLGAVVDGRTWTLTRRGIEPVNDAYERVILSYVSPEGARTRSSLKFRDGKLRTDGEEEWQITGALSGDATWYAGPNSGTNPKYSSIEDADLPNWLPPNKGPLAISWKGEESNSVAVTESIQNLGTSVRQPVIMLTGRKWMDKDTAGAKVKTLPTDANEAMDIALAYAPGEQGNSYETGTNKPKLMHVMSGAHGAKFLCVDIRVYQDGDMVCREALFEYNPAGWNTGAKEPYGPAT